MSATKEEKNKKTEELIRKGLIYIGFPNSERVINMELLIKIRDFINMKTAESNEWYRKKFDQAYRIDKGEIEGKSYSDDGIQYFFKDDSKQELEKYILHESKVETELLPTIKCDLGENDNYIKKGSYYSYNYINEIDHFFTHCINNYLTSKACVFGKKTEKGIVSVKMSIEENS